MDCRLTMAPYSPLVFSVRRSPPELVMPAEPTPNELKLLSDIDDQEGLRFQLPFIMFYSNNNPLTVQKVDAVKVIREGLAKALVYYYPFAGRLREGHNRKLMVDCTGEGILFVEGEADITLEQLGDTIQPPCPYIEELLHDVPGSSAILGCPLLLIQVVRLSCTNNARGKQGLQVPDGFYGNAFAFPTAVTKAGSLCENPLAYALEMVKKIKSEISEEYIRSVADLMVIKGRPRYITAGNYLVADTTRVGFGGIDFGSGKPIYGGPSGAIPFVSFFARFRNRKGEDGVIVPIWLPLPVMERFQRELLKITHQEPVNQSHGVMPKTIKSSL